MKTHTETNHPPVEWEVSRDAVPSYVTQVSIYQGEKRIAAVYDKKAIPLIAVAPDLLAALIELERVESSPHSETTRFLAREQARTAIEKATSERE